MNWIRDVVLVLLITSAAGGILFLAWMAVVYASRGKMNIRYVYWMLRGVLAGYLLSFIYLLIHQRIEHMRNEWDVLSVSTMPLDRMFLALFLIGVLGGLILIASQLHMQVCFQRIKKSSMIVPKKYAVVLERLCAELKIRRTVSAYQGYGVKTPFICGVRNPRIYLPIKNFTEEELEMILYHELIHYKQGDTFWKPVFGLVGNIYWFNPLSWLLWKEAIRWTEANCDFRCCEERFDRKKYFTLLLAMGSMEGPQIYGYIPMWSEGGAELKWRLDCMKKHFRKKTSVICAAIIAVISILGGGMSAHAAREGIRIVYEKAYSNTVEETEVPLQRDELQEQEGTVDDFAEMEIVEHQEDGTETFSANMVWEVGNNSTHYSSEFQAKAGSNIVVIVGVTPSDKTVKVGIVKPDGKTSYVTGKEFISHTFSASKAGTYKVFVSNTSGKKVTVDCSYVVV